MERNSNIDYAKGLLIVLVVLGHGLQFGFGTVYESAELFFDDYLFRAIYTFHMPLFMFICGYLFFHSNQKGFSIIIKSKLRSIGIPWMVFSIIIYILTFWFSRMDTFYFSHFLIMMRSNMWFLSSLLLNCLVVACITHRNRDKCIPLWLLLLLFILTFFIPGSLIPDTHLFMFPYFLMGYWCYQKKLDLHLYLTNSYIMLTLTCVFVITLFIYDRELTIYRGGGICIISNYGIDYAKFAKDVLRFLIGVTNGFWFMGISQRLTKYDKGNGIIMHLGRMTLAIYGFQCIAYVIITEYMNRYKIEISHNYVTPAIICLIILLLCNYIIKLCQLNKWSSLLFLGNYNKQPKLK